MITQRLGRRQQRGAVALLVGLLAAVLACGPSIMQQSSPHAAYAALIVENVGLPDTHVWVTRQGVKGRRLGIVAGFGTDTFLIERRDVAADGDIYLIALAGGGYTGGASYSRGLPIDSGSIWKWSVGQTTGGDGAVPIWRGQRSR